LEVELTSSIAEGAGLLPELLTATCDEAIKTSILVQVINNILFISFDLGQDAFLSTFVQIQ
jgi:hypothetical protein